MTRLRSGLQGTSERVSRSKSSVHRLELRHQRWMEWAGRNKAHGLSPLTSQRFVPSHPLQGSRDGQTALNLRRNPGELDILKVGHTTSRAWQKLGVRVWPS